MRGLCATGVMVRLERLAAGRFFPLGAFALFLRCIAPVSRGASYLLAVSSISRVSEAQGSVNEDKSSISAGAGSIIRLRSNETHQQASAPQRLPAAVCSV